MASVRIVRRHALPHDAVRALVDALAADLEHKLHARHHWEGDTLRFTRSGASGTVAVAPDRIEIDVKLGLALAPMKGRIERTITEYLDVHLA